MREREKKGFMSIEHACMCADVCVCVCVPDILVLVDVDLMELLWQVLHGGHVSHHLQGNEAGQDRHDQALLGGGGGGGGDCHTCRERKKQKGNRLPPPPPALNRPPPPHPPSLPPPTTARARVEGTDESLGWRAVNKKKTHVDT